MNLMRNPLAILLLTLGLGAARAQAAPLKIGVLCDMSGIYADNTGPGLVAATHLGVKEFGTAVNGRPIQVVFADDQNKPDVGAAVAGQRIVALPPKDEVAI